MGGDPAPSGDLWALGAVAYEALTGRCLRDLDRLRRALNDPAAWLPAPEFPPELGLPPELETALEVLWDPGFIHTIDCQLAMLASNAHAFDAADAWLQRCDPRLPRGHYRQ